MGVYKKHINIAHVLINGDWHYLKCEKIGNNWVDIKTNEVIDRKTIYNIE